MSLLLILSAVNNCRFSIPSTSIISLDLSVNYGLNIPIFSQSNVTLGLGIIQQIEINVDTQSQLSFLLGKVGVIEVDINIDSLSSFKISLEEVVADILAQKRYLKKDFIEDRQFKTVFFKD